MSRGYGNTWIKLSVSPCKNAEQYLIEKLAEHLWEEYEDEIDSWYEEKGKTPPPNDLEFIKEIIVDLFDGGWRLSRSFIDAVDCNPSHI